MPVVISFFKIFCQYFACSELLIGLNIFRLNVLSHKGSKVEGKKQRVSDLHSAHLDMNKNRDIMNCFKNLINGEKGLARKPGNGGLNNNRSEEFLMGMAANGTTSMRVLLKELSDNLATVMTDLKPLNLVIWGNVENKASSFPHPSVYALKASVEKEYAKMSVDFVKKMHATFSPRLEAMLKAECGHLEK